MVSTKKKMSIGKRGDLIFHLGLLAWPILQFCVFYIAVNLNSFKLAFEQADNLKGYVDWHFFDNFRYIFSDTVFPGVLKAAATSIEFYLITTAISVPLGLLFAYYIFKKAAGSKLFRFFLFLPSIISSMVMVVLFSNFMQIAGSDILADCFGFKSNHLLFDTTDRSSYGGVLFFYVWTNFGTTTLIYSNKMGELPPETLEAAQLDGASSIQEFTHIVLPFAFPTASVFLVTGLATIFSNQYNVFSFYGGGGLGFDSGPLGYYLFNLVESYATQQEWGAEYFNYASALSLLITMIVIPVTLTARWALDKFGPQE